MLRCVKSEALKSKHLKLEFVSLQLLIKFFSVLFQPKWLPVVSFLNLCQALMFHVPSCPTPPDASTPYSTRKEGMKKTTQILGLHGNSSQVTLSPTCSAESEIEGWVRGMWGGKEREGKIDDTQRTCWYLLYCTSNRLFLCGCC